MQDLLRFEKRRPRFPGAKPRVAPSDRPRSIDRAVRKIQVDSPMVPLLAISVVSLYQWRPFFPPDPAGRLSHAGPPGIQEPAPS